MIPFHRNVGPARFIKDSQNRSPVANSRKAQSRKTRRRRSAGVGHSFSGGYQTLESRQLLATLEIWAAGQTNDETLQLEIGGSVVQEWTNLGGNASTGQFVRLVYSTPGSINAADVRLVFTNDAYDPANNYDRNVRVDALSIDGRRLETEAETVFSTGTWLAADGIVPGFRRSEFLHSNGYFQFDAGNSNTGSEIAVRVRGEVGGEQFAIAVGGTRVRTFTATTEFTDYRYRAPGNVTPDQIRVEFLNDRYEPATGVDLNLQVDYLVVDGEVFQTEAPTVFSTGTWVPTQGVVPGFRGSEWLHTNGYFQYARAARPGNIFLAESVRQIAENAGRVGITVLRENGTDGTVTVDYRTVGITATPGEDYQQVQGTLTFNPGETSKTVWVTLLDDTRVEGDEQFGFTIDNVGGGGALLAPRTATITIQDNDSIRAAGTGLLGEYFDNLNFANRFLNRVDAQVNFDWGLNAPASGMGSDTFSVRWTGQIEPRFTQTYTFSVRVDDGVRLWVNDQLIIDRWIDQAATVHQGSIALQAGVLTNIRLEYYERTGSAVAQLSWQSPSQPLELIPRSQLYPAAAPPVVPGDELRAQTLFSGLVQPTAVKFSPDGRLMWIAEQRGIVRVAENGNLLTSPFLDFRDRVNGTRDRGLLDIAVHPNFPETPYLYLLYTYDPPQVNQQPAGTLAGPDGNGNRAGRLTRVTANAATNFTTVVAGSEVVLVGRNSTWNNFNAFANSTTNFSEPPAGILPDGSSLADFIATDSESHTVGALKFAPDGALFVSIGDGTSYNQVDPRTSRVQSLDNLSGKILRIDPVTGRGLPDNPFFNGNPDANRSKVYQLGLRNPFRMGLNPDNGRLFIGDVGWTQWEEINAAPAGANFGWPWFEGGNGVNLRTGGYQNLAAAQAFYASGQNATPGFYALNHSSGINAIVVGDWYKGTAYPSQFQNSLFFNDLGQGIVRTLRLNANGSVNSVQTFATGHRYVVQMTLGPDDNMYYVDLDDGVIGRWVFWEGNSNASAAGSVTAGQPPMWVPPGSPVTSNLTVALIDSGIAGPAQIAPGSLWTNPGEISGDGIDNDGNGWIDDRHGFDFVTDQGDLIDEAGHGTFLAGLLAGTADNVTSAIAPGVRVMPLRVLGSDGVGASQRIAAAIRYAVEQGAQIVSLPLEVAPSESVRQAIQFAGDRGVLVVVAAGNQGSESPALLAELSAEFSFVVAAGAVAADGQRLPESNRVGQSAAVQIDAPGIAFGFSGNLAGLMRGTSVATAWLTGAAAIAWDQNRLLTAAQVRDVLVASGTAVAANSDSVARLDIAAARVHAQELHGVGWTGAAGTWVLRGTAASGAYRWSVGERELTINGVRWNVPEFGQAASYHWQLSSHDHQLDIAGTAAAETVRASVTGLEWNSAAQQFTVSPFGRLHLTGGGGRDSLEIQGTADAESVSSKGATVHFQGPRLDLEAQQFEIIRVFGNGGADRGTMIGTSAGERVVGGTSFLRIVLPTLPGQPLIQLNRFSDVTGDLGAGFDTVIFEGSSSPEELAVSPNTARFSGNNFVWNLQGLERTTAFGRGGGDRWTMQDGSGVDVINALPGNLLWLGPDYDHRAYQFAFTELMSSGNPSDRVTLRGTPERENVAYQGSLLTFTGSTFETRVQSFPTVLVIGMGGGDTSEIVGSSGREEFYFSPTLFTMSNLSTRLTLRQFSAIDFDGQGGDDRVTLVDGASSDVLTLSTTGMQLESAAYRVQGRNFGFLQAISSADLAPDWIRRESDLRDYFFEAWGDWLEL